MEAQRTLDWYRARLGNVTGSRVADIMKSGRKKDEEFGDTAMTYIYSLAAERDMNPVIIEDDAAFEEYLYQVNVETKAMRWGTEQEQHARELYEKKTGRRIVEVGSCKHPTIEHFASSPDGFFYDENTGEKGCIEIKCPTQAVFMKYSSNVRDSATLLLTEPKYFFQCMAHMMCTRADWCDFVVFNPFQKRPLHIVRILPDKSAFTAIEDKINKANELINSLLHGKRDTGN
ncbi:lambda exonuclease family protein [Bacteroides heparinolyticus]|uniref:lambda exonuclease family protein n=1 Tax=Prevotella heparinolytica TaxID=28113 RepID=UPI003AEF5D9E